MPSGSPVILWVDDDVMMNVELTAPFYLAGYDVVPVTTLRDAKVAVVTRPRLDMAILDMRVPVGADIDGVVDVDDITNSRGGFDAGILLARFIQRIRPDLPFIGLSVSRDKDVIKWFRTEGAGYISKP